MAFVKSNLLKRKFLVAVLLFLTALEEIFLNFFVGRPGIVATAFLIVATALFYLVDKTK